MPYINYQDDPIARRVNNSFANLCAGDPTKKVLKILDKCFVIVNQGKTEAKFCSLENMRYPVDSHLLVDFEVGCNDTLAIFDNGLGAVPSSSPSGEEVYYPLGSGTEYMVPAGYTTPSGPSGPSGPSAVPYYYILDENASYSRGCLLYIEYPMRMNDGGDLIPADKTCQIQIFDREDNLTTYPISEFFSYFANPITRNADQLINKIQIHNPSSRFCIKVKGMIIYVKNNIDPNNCNC